MKLRKIVNPESRSRARFAPRLTLLLGLSAALASTGSLRAASKAVEYAITDLGDLGDPIASQAQSQAYAINVNNQVVGEATTASGNIHAFLYSGGKMIDLGTLATTVDLGESYAYGINDQGVVVGQTANSKGQYDAFYYETSVPGAQIVDMGTLPGGAEGSSALGINNVNEIVGGSYQTWGEVPNAFRCSVGSTMSDLASNSPLLIDHENVATGINSGGVIVGYLQPTKPYAAPLVPFIDDGGLSQMPLVAGDVTGQANAINSAGIMVGVSAGVSGAQAVKWDAGGAKRPKGLGYLPSTAAPASAALGINSAGQIVGSSDVATGTPHAIIYQNGAMTDLNNVIAKGQSGGFLILSVATAINDSGAIVGYGLRTAGGSYFAFLAIPNVPTPLP